MPRFEGPEGRKGREEDTAGGVGEIENDFRLHQYESASPASQLEVVRQELGMDKDLPDSAVEEEISPKPVEIKKPSLFSKIRRWFTVGAAVGAGTVMAQNEVQSADKAPVKGYTYEQKLYAQKNIVDDNVVTENGIWATLLLREKAVASAKIKDAKEAEQFIKKSHQDFIAGMNGRKGVALLEKKTEAGESMIIPLRGQTSADWHLIESASSQLALMFETVASKWKLAPETFRNESSQVKEIIKLSSEKAKQNKDIQASPTYGKDPNKPDLVTITTNNAALPKNVWQSSENKPTTPDSSEVSKKEKKPRRVLRIGTFTAGSASPSNVDQNMSGGKRNSEYPWKTVRDR